MYQNLYKNIDDKISNLKDNLKIDIDDNISNVKDNLKIDIYDKVSNLEKDLKTEILSRATDKFRGELDKIKKRSNDDLNSFTKSSKAKFNEISNEINRITKVNELRNKNDDLIQNIKNEYAIFYAQQSNPIGLTLDLAKLEKILRSIKSEDKDDVTKNLKYLISMLLCPGNPFEQAVLDYLRLLYESGHFDKNNDGQKFLKENIVEGFFNGSFR